MYTVPQPRLKITTNRNGPVYAGGQISLSVDINISHVVNVNIDIAVRWSRGTGNAVMIVTDDRTIVTPMNNLGRAFLTYSPVSTSDSGLTTATVTVSPADGSVYVEPVTTTSSIMLNITGMRAFYIAIWQK